MKNNNVFPDFNNGDFPELDPAWSELFEVEKQYALLYLQGMMSPDDQKITPDTYRCECFFLKNFVTPEMEDDFALIAKDFLQHEMPRLGEYNELTFVCSDPIDTWPEKSFQYEILNLMMGAARKENAYAKSLFCYLHKTYYKKEYKILKRFQKISASEVANIACDKNHKISDYSIARILCMAKMYGIEMTENCTLLYLLLDRHWADMFEYDKPYFHFPEGSIEEAEQELKELFSDEYDMLELSEDVELFTGNVLNYFCCREDFVWLCDSEYFGMGEMLRKTLAMMKLSFPGKQFTKEDILIYGQIWKAVSALQSVCGDMYELLEKSLGVSKFNDERIMPPLFHPEDIKVNVEANKNPKSINEKVVIKKEEPDSQIDPSVLMKEIEQLRNNLHLQENTNRELRRQLQETERKYTEQQEYCKSLEEDRKELSALRDHVYHLTEGVEIEAEMDQEEMIQKLRDKDIMIVGGHDKWVNKIRQIFPNWKFISPSVSAAVSSMQTAKIDKAYFFTDTLSHSQYYKYVQVIRNRDIPFGYIHGVNISTNIQQIYGDFFK